MSHDPLSEAAKAAADAESPESVATGSGAGEERGATPNADSVIRLPPALTIAEVAEIHALLLKNLMANVPFSIAAEDVESIDTAGLQLVAAVLKSAAAKGVDVTLSAPSAVMCAAVKQVGLSGMAGFEPCGQVA
ncbi:MAG: STAS domain-containing protein [Chromatiaceae bacterium]|nr:STAS domain-containing protein [Chromatiaceae bacterium]MCP5421997.1 STAS domain-containing protein [Chromatiaceae bacterium]